MNRSFLMICLLSITAVGCGEDTGVGTPPSVTYSLLTEDGGTLLEWSPDGERIAFSKERSIWAISTSGGEATKIVDGGSLSWSPDGTMMVYHKGGPVAGTAYIYVMADTTPPDTSLAWGGNPDWSPDGDWLAYDSYTWWEWPTEGIRLISPSGGVVRVVTALGQHPHWSPDGENIAFCTQNCDSLGIWTVSPNGDALVQLTTDYHWFPRWSPDGRWIAYFTYYDWRLYVIPADGGTPIHISGGPETKAWPTWSPDGEKIAFSSYNDGAWEIWVASNLPF